MMFASMAVFMMMMMVQEVGQLEAELKEKVDWEIKTSKRINKILGEIKQVRTMQKVNSTYSYFTLIETRALFH